MFALKEEEIIIEVTIFDWRTLKFLLHDFNFKLYELNPNDSINRKIKLDEENFHQIIWKIDELVVRNITPSTIYLWKEALQRSYVGVEFDRKESALNVVVILIHKVQSEWQSLSEMRKSVCFVMRMESVEI